jgi:hypothetical protein
VESGEGVESGGGCVEGRVYVERRKEGGREGRREGGKEGREDAMFESFS